mmetsp:Transcript_18916/g.27976  ORF Transcript_18916/g.27976 Transcript_18916/m.27976 type:complete len:210 (-) Transcript_18916:1801-2430(-)
MRVIAFLCLLSLAETAAWTSPKTPKSSSNALEDLAKFSATAALGLMLATTPLPADAASTTAAQIQLDSVPPSTISVQVSDLPVVGNLVSGVYSKLPEKTIKDASITIKSPKDKIAAIKSATSGHLEFDVGGLVKTHLDVDVATNEAGVATVRVASPLIPKLPFQNKASATTAKGGKTSDWVAVTNMGNGQTYYFNEKTQESQYNAPSSY